MPWGLTRKWLSRWWFQILFFNFHPYLGKISHFDDHIFQNRLVQPPTSYEQRILQWEDGTRWAPDPINEVISKVFSPELPP